MGNANRAQGESPRRVKLTKPRFDSPRWVKLTELKRVKVTKVGNINIAEGESPRWVMLT